MCSIVSNISDARRAGCVSRPRPKVGSPVRIHKPLWVSVFCAFPGLLTVPHLGEIGTVISEGDNGYSVQFCNEGSPVHEYASEYLEVI
jgi:hypothetical protein